MPTWVSIQITGCFYKVVQQKTSRITNAHIKKQRRHKSIINVCVCMCVCMWACVCQCMHACM